MQCSYLSPQGKPSTTSPESQAQPWPSVWQLEQGPPAGGPPRSQGNTCHQTRLTGAWPSGLWPCPPELLFLKDKGMCTPETLQRGCWLTGVSSFIFFPQVLYRTQRNMFHNQEIVNTLRGNVTQLLKMWFGRMKAWKIHSSILRGKCWIPNCGHGEIIISLENRPKTGRQYTKMLKVAIAGWWDS